MSAPTRYDCPICLRSMTEIFREPSDFDGRIEEYRAVDIHVQANGVAHKAHDICISRWFLTQLASSQDLSHPLSCPLCRENIEVINAQQITGINFLSILVTEYLSRTRVLYGEFEGREGSSIDYPF